MPLDPSKHHQDRRRLARDPIAAVRQDGMFSREIELKRNRGEISCAECRRCVASHSPLLPRSHPLHVSARLKIKCDKQIPCQSCQVRPTSTAPRVPFLTPHTAERLRFFMPERSVLSSIFWFRVNDTKMYPAPSLPDD